MSALRPLHTLVADPVGRAIAYVFAANSIAFANWAARIPVVQEQLALSEAALGLALMGLPVGAIGAMLLVGPLTARVGAGRVTFVAGFCFLAAAVTPTLAWSLPSLALALALAGAGNGALDVAMNAAAAEAETRIGRPIMAACHGFWSLGAMLGAGLGAGAAALRIPFPLHLAAVCAALAVLLLAFRRLLLTASRPERGGVHGHRALALPTGPLLGLGGLALLILVGEGAMADWSAVYLRRVLEVGPGVAGLGYAAFAAAMTAGRFLGDAAVERVGETGVLRGGAWLAAAGLSVGLVLQHPAAALLGFACVGLGYAGAVPVLFRAGARAPGQSPGAGIAAVSSAGYAGFLAGPPVIGLVAEGVGLGGALGLVAVLAAVVAMLAPRVLAAAAPGNQPAEAPAAQVPDQ